MCKKLSYRIKMNIKFPNPQILKSSNSQIFKFPNSQILKFSNLQIPKSSNLQLLIQILHCHHFFHRFLHTISRTIEENDIAFALFSEIFDSFSPHRKHQN